MGMDFRYLISKFIMIISFDLYMTVEMYLDLNSDVV